MDEVLVKYTTANSRFVVIEGMLVHYRDEGNGYPMVMVHGAFSSLHTFNAWSSELSGDFRVIRYDLPGFGLTGAHPRHDYSMDAHLRVLRNLLDMLGISRCVLCGNSLGGWITWEFALRYPYRVRKLILLDSAGFLDDNSIPLAFKMARTPFMNRVAKYVIRKNILEQFLHQVYYDNNKVSPELLDRYYKLFTREGNPEAFFMLVNKTAYKDNTRKLKGLETPTLIIWGEEDRWLPVENAHRFLNLIPRSRLVIYENTGHIPMEEEPEDTAAEVRRFIHGGGDQSNLFYE
ncbi:MAG: alpha/beta fold hydrolase [Saprospiraceae bacterium]